jgi:capsular polysaccharide biosynthesis protein
MNYDFMNFINSVRKDHFASIAYSGTKLARYGKRIFISRKGALARQMKNEAELVESLRGIGFEIFDSDGLDFRRQAAAFAEATFVVGAHGAGLTNAAFAMPGAVLLELRPLNRSGESPMWGMSYKNLSSIMGFSYCAHVSENKENSEEWVANVPEIMQTIDLILADMGNWRSSLAGV